MPATFDFMGGNIVPPEQNYTMQQQYSQPMMQPQRPAPMPVPEVVVEPSGINFPTIDDINDNSKMTISIDPGPLPDVGLPTKKRGRPRKNEVQTINGSEIVKAEVEENSTLSTYSETAFLLKNTIDQVDMVASEVKHELDAVRNNRTFKNRYNTMVGLTSNLSDLLNAKISAIKEMNNCISKANDMDYKIRKDRKDAEAGIGDDKLIMDLYQTITQNPTNNFVPQGNMQMPPANAGLGIVRAPEDGVAPGQADQGYLNYMANLTPEQNMMLLEQNPDVKQCVVFDAATGNRWFQVMNVKTGQPIPNAPTLDPMFMEDVTLDTKNKIAKNINLAQTYPLIIINDGVAKEY